MTKRILVITALLMILPLMPGRSVADDGDGGQPGSFFQIPIGARPTAMGGAYLAISNDGAAPLFNSAGLATIKKKLFATSYRVMQLDRRLGYMTLMFPTRDNSALGINWHYFGSGDVQMRDRNGRPLDFDIGLQSHAISIVFAKQFERYLLVGLKAGYLHSCFAEMTAFSVGIDFGLMFNFSELFDREWRDELTVNDLQAGLVVKNIAAKYKWNTDTYNDEIGGEDGGTVQDDKIPIEVGLGLSGRLLDRKLLLATDVLKNEKQDFRFHAGAEYFVSHEFAVRSGYGGKRFTAGTGYVFRIGRQALAIDYAFSTDRADEGSEHIFSFDLLF